MAVIIGQRITRFYLGKKFVFERVTKGEWELIEPRGSIIPSSVIEDLPE